MTDEDTFSASSPAHYPKNISYKPLVDEIRRLSKEKNKEKTAGDGSGWKRYRLKDGGELTMKFAGEKQVTYELKLSDGRRITLERKATDMSLEVTDKSGAVIKTLGCEL